MKMTIASALAAGLLLAGANPAARAADAGVSMQSTSGSRASGQLILSESAQGVHVGGEVRGLVPGRHGLHIHEKGDCSAADAESAGGHFNPGAMKHGGLRSSQRHAGDLGNVDADQSGTARIDISASGLSLTAGKTGSILGHAVIVHEKADDEATDPAGNSGKRVACGVIRQ